jgi:hypothetical protein
MKLKHATPEQTDAFGRMSREVYDEYRNLKFAGVTIEPSRYLVFREQTKNYLHTKLVVSDAGVFFMDAARKIKFKFDRWYFFVYHDGLDAADEEKIRKNDSPITVLDNLLEFWNRPGTGLCLVADHLNGCQYLLPDQKEELDKVQRLYSQEGFVINPMLHKKKKDGVEAEPQKTGLVDLNSL